MDKKSIKISVRVHSHKICLFLHIFVIISTYFVWMHSDWYFDWFFIHFPFISVKLVQPLQCVFLKVNICYNAPNRPCHHRGTQVHGAHQTASHIPPLNLPSRSQYSFTDHDLRMEGWVSPGPGCIEQLAHGCYATARGSGARTRISRSKVEHANR